MIESEARGVSRRGGELASAGFVLGVLGAALPFGPVADDRVDLWVIGLDLDDHWIGGLKAVLDPHELASSEALRPTLLQTRFITAHAAVRNILGRYLDLAAEDVRFERETTGKPELPDSPLAFSVAVADGLAVCAVTLGGNPIVAIDAMRQLPVAEDGENGSDAVRRVTPSCDAAGKRWIEEFEPRPGFVGTLSLARPIERIARCHWHPGVPLWMNDEHHRQSTWL